MLSFSNKILSIQFSTTTETTRFRFLLVSVFSIWKVRAFFKFIVIVSKIGYKAFLMHNLWVLAFLFVQSLSLSHSRAGFRFHTLFLYFALLSVIIINVLHVGYLLCGACWIDSCKFHCYSKPRIHFPAVLLLIFSIVCRLLQPASCNAFQLQIRFGNILIKSNISALFQWSSITQAQYTISWNVLPFSMNIIWKRFENVLLDC